MPSKTSKIKPNAVKIYDQVVGQGNFTWKPGVISLVAEDRLPIGAVVEAKNMMQTQDGVWGTRWGSSNYGAAYTGPVTGFQEFTYGGTNYTAIVDAGIFKYSKDGGAWTKVLVPAGTPATAPTATAATGTALGIGAYGYKVTYLCGGGETLPSTVGTVTTTSNNQDVNLTAIPTSSVPSVTGRNIYRTKVGGSTYYLLTTINDNTTTTYADTTPDASLPATTAPTSDTSTILYNTTAWTNMLQWENKLLLCNGHDAFSYIDLTSFTYTGYTHESAPGTITPTLVNLSAGSYNIYYSVTAVTAVGETLPATTVTANVNIDRSAWYNPNSTQITTASSYGVTLSWAALGGSNVIGYNIYASDNVSGVLYYLDSVGQVSGTVSYTDWGFAAINDFIGVPTADTTTAPSFSYMALSDNRLWTLGDPNNKYRLYWSGTGPQYNTAFSVLAGGGWVDILPGGNQTPQWIGDFRNGQGQPMTTVLMEEPTGYGSTWHVSLTTQTIGNSVVTIPTVVQSLATFGTGSPRAVIQTNQNVYFHSSGPAGIYSTGSVSTLFNILATNEISILIRPDIKTITASAISGLCGIEYDRKLWFSVPYGNSTNNRIMIYDLEKENWNPYAFDFGVLQFARYTDNSGVLHLLAIPTTGTHIIEINEDFISDNGSPLNANLTTGLIHVTSDHVDFAHIQYVFYEFGAPQGSISITFSGTVKNLPLGQIASYTVSEGDVGSGVGFSSYAFSTKPFSYAAKAPAVTTALSIKERVKINKLVNNWQVTVSSNTSGTSWVLNQVVVRGQQVPTAAPSTWIVN